MTFGHGRPVQPGRDIVGGSLPIKAGQQAVAGTQHLHEEETTPSGGEYQRGAEKSQYCGLLPGQNSKEMLQLWTCISFVTPVF